MSQTSRLPGIDLVRGFALLLMAVYHGGWDISAVGLAAIPVLTDPGWFAFRVVILSSFLAVAGFCQALGYRPGRALDRRAWRRLGLIGVAALAVSAATYVTFPDAFIFFGVLHFLLIASVALHFCLRLPAVALPLLAALVFAARWLVDLPGFGAPWLIWTGLSAENPISVDWVPFAPWFAVMLLAAALGLRARDPGNAIARLLARDPFGRLGAGLRWIGRRSLAFYLIHQPVLFGLAYLAALAIGGEREVEGLPWIK